MIKGSLLYSKFHKIHGVLLLVGLATGPLLAIFLSIDFLRYIPFSVESFGVIPKLDEFRAHSTPQDFAYYNEVLWKALLFPLSEPLS